MMPELVRYADNQLPGAFRPQILALHRGEWPEGYSGAFHGRDWIQRSWFHPTHWVLVKDGVVVSYVGVTWKHLAHAGEVGLVAARGRLAARAPAAAAAYDAGAAVVR